MKKRLRESEKSVESAIITRLRTSGWRVHKLDSQSIAGREVVYEKGGWTSKRRYTDPTAEVGQPDLLAVRSWGREPQYRGQGDVLYIECKASGEEPDVFQKAYHEELRQAGYTVLVPHSEREFEQQMAELGLMLR